jgi:hypothetical protein
MRNIKQQPEQDINSNPFEISVARRRHRLWVKIILKKMGKNYGFQRRGGLVVGGAASLLEFAAFAASPNMMNFKNLTKI